MRAEAAADEENLSCGFSPLRFSRSTAASVVNKPPPNKSKRLRSGMQQMRNDPHYFSQRLCVAVTVLKEVLKSSRLPETFS